ncbi:sensor histidine kinase [Phenylobacterium aquaticum]|uniref:sensor histidine kinase n=1 Tax=Phenylobacterium aquaticum TaxID=1763816 RepID=UPI001F5C6B30|nr:HWE histidine kinase domain-containing protein [Phenylobacterium aquaticum]MCI3131006.1 PAS domain-containing protein [Phenylobacterium aquaticum]
MGADASIGHHLATALAEEVRRADCLNRIATAIAVGNDLDSVVQAVVDGGVELTEAAFGAFFYNVEDAAGERYTLYALSGAPREAFSRYPMPRKTAIFAPTFDGVGVVRSDDISKDPRYGLSGPYHGMPPEHLPVRSYLAAPVIGRDGEVLGGLFFGHPETGRFTARVQDLLVGVAAQAAVAIETMRLKETARRELASLQFALKAGRMGSWELDVETGVYTASDICKHNYGRAADATFGFQDLIDAIHPEDRPQMRAAIDAAIAHGSAYDVEYRVILPDGELRWIQVRGRAAQTAQDGGARRLAGVSLDITERKRAEQRQQLLLNELNHRVKNTLATVQAIARQTLRGCPNPEDFSEAFEARLLALSQTHNLLTEQNWRSASLMAILAAELRPHGGARDSRFVLDGDGDMQLNPKAAVALGMAMHELATNAVKYGALSGPEGRVTLRSRRVGEGEDRKLVLEWIESGGPPVAPPSRRGLGARLLEDGLAGELSSVVRLDYRPEGVACRMELPMRVVETAE